MKLFYCLFAYLFFFGSCSTKIEDCFNPGLDSAFCSLQSFSVSYMGSDGTVGNTQLVVNAANGLLSSMSGTITTGTFTTTLNGSVTIAADGGFTYNPPVGVTGNDTFTYDVTDTAGTIQSVNVTLQISDMVWYVQNNAAAAGDGRSHLPFQTLASAASASSAGHTIYIREGDGTVNNQNSGIVLKNNQKLLGQGVALVRLNKILVSATNRPTIGNTTGSGITLASGNEIRGLRVQETTNHAIYSASAVTGLLIDQIEITGTGTATEAGIRLDNFTGTFEVYQSVFDTTKNNIGNAIDLTTLNNNTLTAIIAQNVFNGSSASGNMSDAVKVTVGTGSGTGTQNVRVIENTITTLQGGTSQVGVHMIANNDSSPDILIDGNSITSTSDQGILFQGNNSSTPRIDVINNSVTNSTGIGVNVRINNGSTGNSEIFNNTVSNTSTQSMHVRASGTGNMTSDINNNTISSTTNTALIVINSGSGTNTNYNVRNNTITGSASHGFEVAFTSTAGGGSTCSRLTGNNVSGLTPTVSHYRTNQEGGSSQSLEDTVGGSASVNAYVQAANTGFTAFNHVNAAPTLVASGTCTQLANLRPRISDIGNQSVASSSSLTGIAFTVTDVQDTDANLTVSVDTSDQTLVPNANITINHLGGNSRSLDITPASGLTGAALIIVSVTDSGGLVSMEVFKLTVT